MKKTVILLLLSFILTPVESSHLPLKQDIEINQTIQQIVSANSHPYVESHIFSSYKEIIDELYFLSPQHLLWINPVYPDKQRIDAVFQLIANAEASGLNADYYNLSLLKTKWQQLINQEHISEADYVFLDTAISINLIHFLSDIHFGRINPVTLDINYNFKNQAITLIPVILEALKNNKISELTEILQPSSTTYLQLKKTLLDYQNTPSRQALIDLQYLRSLRPNDTSQQIVKIRQQLSIINQSTYALPPSPVYDPYLASKIKQFQFQHGLQQDGIIGRDTIKALNIKPYQRIQMIKLALERLRWLPKLAPSPLIMVNIPAFKLKAYHPDSENKDKTQTLNMKVIVGKSKKKKFKSPVFSANMYYLEFSPYWNIPKSITLDEILPQLQENPLYLEQNNIEVVSGFHDNETALPYTEDSFEQLQSGDLMLRQRPGKGNALGKVKFIFPNNYNVYLHDTPARHLFRKPKRDLSHGCIRVEKPTELAQFLLQTRKGWNQKEVIKAMHLPSPKKVRLKKAIPVIIYYSTVSVEQGNVVFYNDVYNYDAKLAKALFKHKPSPLIPSTKDNALSKIELTTLN